jgi:hypothetical protein
LHDIARAAANPLAAGISGMVPKAKRVIFVFMNGGPSQLDLFDPKPKPTALSHIVLPVN